MSEELTAKALVTEFYQIAFGEGRVAEAAEKYISAETYIQHNPGVADGRDAFVAALTAATGPGGLRADIKRVVAEGDLVAVHSRWASITDSSAAPLAVFDIFRVENGLIVEHWDAMQPVPAEMAHGNGMF